MAPLIFRAQINSNGRGLGAAWHLSHIEVVNTGTNEKLVFPFHGWVDKKHGLEHMLHPDRDGDGKADAADGSGGVVEYQVQTFTSDIRGAGTTSDITVRLQSEQGPAELCLTPSVLSYGRHNDSPSCGSIPSAAITDRDPRPGGTGRACQARESSRQ